MINYVINEDQVNSVLSAINELGGIITKYNKLLGSNVNSTTLTPPDYMDAQTPYDVFQELKAIKTQELLTSTALTLIDTEGSNRYLLLLQGNTVEAVIKDLSTKEVKGACVVEQIMSNAPPIVRMELRDAVNNFISR